MAAKQSSTAYLRYGIILGLMLIVRVFDIVTWGTVWRARASESLQWGSVLCGAALIVCILVVQLGRRRYPPAMTVLLSILAGAATTIVASSAIGMVVGLVVGLALTYDATRSWTFAALRLVVPACLTGFIVGLLGAMTLWLRHGQHSLAALAVLFTVLAAASLIWCLWRATSSVGSRGRLIINAVAFLLISLLSVPWGVQMDTLRRRAAISGRIDCLAGMFPVPFGREMLFRGLWDVDELWVRRHFHSADAAYVGAFQNVRAVLAQGSEFDDRALSEFVTSPTIAALRLVRPGITDHGLTALQGCPNLVDLHLDGANITGSGLRYLRPTVLLMNTVSLSNTQVDDEGLRHLSVPVISVNLNNTRVRGDGLRHLDMAGLTSLSLANTPLEEKYLESLIRAPLSNLRLDGVPISAAGAATLSRMTSLTRLFVGAGLTDQGIKPLDALQLEFFGVDASLLGEPGLRVVSRTPHVELSYNADVISLEGIIHSVETVRAEMSGQKFAPPKFRPRNFPPVTVRIDNLVIERDMVQGLRKLDGLVPLQLTNVRIGLVALPRFATEDLSTHFPDVPDP